MWKTKCVQKTYLKQVSALGMQKFNGLCLKCDLPVTPLNCQVQAGRVGRKNCEAQKVKQLYWEFTERKERGRLNIMPLLSWRDPDIV